MNTLSEIQTRKVPLLLYDGGCATCVRIASWVQRSASTKTGEPTIIARPVGNDPQELRRLNRALDIWDTYAVSHVIMPDGSMKLGGEAVAEVFRCLSVTKWMASCFDITIFGIRPFQKVLNLGYHVLDDIRPILGCESCGRSKPWARPIESLTKWAKGFGGKAVKPGAPLHFMPLAAPHQHLAGASCQPVAKAKRLTEENGQNEK